jgi:hypothetical protein
VRTHLEGLAEALRILKEGDEVCKSDAEMGYFHVALQPACRRFFRFKRRGRTWQMRVVFFGLKTAGYVFSTMMACWVRLLRLPSGVQGCPKEHGLRLSRYMDDVMYAHAQGGLKEAQCRWIWPTSGVLGVCWGAKSDWEPAQEVGHLGALVRVGARKVELKQEVRTKLRAQLRRVVRRPRITVGAVLQLVGRLRAFREAVPNGHLMSWVLGAPAWGEIARQTAGASTWSVGRLRAHWGRLRRATVGTGEMRRAAKWLLERLHPGWGRHWGHEKRVFLTVDASPKGVGAKASGVCAVVPWPKEWAKDLERNQPRREVMGVPIAVEALQEQCLRGRVVLQGDCTAALAAFGRMRNGALAPWAATALWACLDLGVELEDTQWIPSRQMVTTGVDGLSRWVDSSDWRVSNETWARITAWAPGLQVDRFAAVDNHRLSRWCSRWAQPGTEHVDALTADWRATWSYACPPLSLVSATVALLQQQQAAAVLVVPQWTDRAWWSSLTAMAGGGHWLRLGTGTEAMEVGPSGKGGIMHKQWAFWAVKVNWQG